MNNSVLAPDSLTAGPNDKPLFAGGGPRTLATPQSVEHPAGNAGGKSRSGPTTCPTDLAG